MTGTSHLLMNEYPLIVLPSLAAKIGLNEAIILQQIHWWTSKGKNIRDSRSWVYNTYADWTVQFPFWSERTIKRTVSNLEKAGLILSTSKYNQMQIDKTKWYTVDYEKLELMARPSGQNGTSSVTNWPHPSGQNDLTNNHRSPETNSKNKEYMHLEDLDSVRITKEEYEKLLALMSNEETVKDYLYKFAAWIITQKPAKQKTASAYLSVRNWYKRDSEQSNQKPQVDKPSGGGSRQQKSMSLLEQRRQEALERERERND